MKAASDLSMKGTGGYDWGEFADYGIGEGLCSWLDSGECSYKMSGLDFPQCVRVCYRVCSFEQFVL